MNSTSRILDLPPPPGTEDVELETLENPVKPPEEEKFEDIKKEKDIETEKSVERPIDRINPYLKNPEYVEYEKRHMDHRHRTKSRSHSREKYHRRRYSRSRSRDRHRRSRSRSRRRRRRYSSSRSRSHSSSYRRHKYNKRRKSVSRYSRSRSASRSSSKSASKLRQRSHKSRNHRDKKTPLRTSNSQERDKYVPDADTNEIDMKLDEDEDTTKDNVFKNDGTFLEMFKKMQEQQKKVEETAPPPETSKKILPSFGKRRGGKVLKTGLVQKVKQSNEEESTSQDAWSVYMKEVRKYKEACCDDDSKTRPLVK